MRGIGAGVRIFDLLDRKPAIPPETGVDVEPSRRGNIKFEKVTFEYPSRKNVTILKELDLEVSVGESVAIVYVGAVYLLQNNIMLTPRHLLAGRAEVENLLSTLSSCVTTIRCPERSPSMAKVSNILHREI